MPLARLTRGLLAPAFLGLATAGFCWKLVFGGLVVIGYDTMTYMYPYRVFAAEALKAGRIPLWNPHIYFGVPFLANLQSGVFYPLHLPFLLLPAPWAMNWSVVLHLYLCACFGYVAARVLLRVDALSAAVAGAIYGLGGFVGAQVGHLNQLNAAAWLPLALSTLHLALERRSLPWLAALAAVLGVQLLAGHAQESYMTGILLGGYVAFRIATRVPAGARAVALESAWGGASLAAGGSLAAGIAAVQLLPSSELTGYSIRAAGMSFGEAASFSLPPRELFVGLLPSFGLASPTSNEYLAWTGFSGLTLALFAVLFRVRRPPVLFFFIVALGGFVLALGNHFPVYEWAFHIPGVRLFRVPARWLMLTTFATAMLAGAGLAFVRRLGAHGWTSTSASDPDGPSVAVYAGPWQRLVAATRLLLAFGVIAAVAAFLWPFQKPGPGTIPGSLVWVWAVGAAVAVALSFWALAAAPSRVPGALFACVVVGELFVASRPLEYNNPNPPSVYTDSRPVHDALARAVTPADRYVSIAATGYHPSDAKQLVADYEPALGPAGVLATLINTKYKEILTPNLPMVYGFRSVDGYDGGVLPLRRYVDYKRLVVPDEQNVPDALLRDQLRQMPPASRLRALGATYVIADSIGDVTEDGVYYDLAAAVPVRPQSSVTLRNVGLAGGVGPYGPVSRVGIVTSLEGALDLVDGAPVATITLRSSSAGGGGQPAGVWQARLIAGSHTAEGAYVASARHRQPRPLGSVASGGTAVAAYLAQIEVGPAWAESIVIQNVMASATLRVLGLSLIGEGSAQWPVSLAGEGDLALVHRSDVKLYHDERPLPRAYVVPRAIVADGLESALSVLSTDGHDPRALTVLERAPFVPPPAAGPRGQLRRLRDGAFEMLGIERDPVPGALLEGAPVPVLPATGSLDGRTNVRWIEDSPERVWLRVTAPQGGLLVLRDTFYPGWNVTVDGRTTDALRADVLFRAVPLPVGGLEPHDVILTYRSLPFERGLIVTAAALALTLALVVAPYAGVARPRPR